MIIDSINDIKLTQYTYTQLLTEIEALKLKALYKLKKEDPNVKRFIESKLYLLLKSNVIKVNNKYEYYLKCVDNYNECITKEVFEVLMKEGINERH